MHYVRKSRCFREGSNTRFYGFFKCRIIDNLERSRLYVIIYSSRSFIRFCDLFYNYTLYYLYVFVYLANMYVIYMCKYVCNYILISSTILYICTYYVCMYGSVDKLTPWHESNAMLRIRIAFKRMLATLITLMT